jgi:hypothetical protein
MCLFGLATKNLFAGAEVWLARKHSTSHGCNQLQALQVGSYANHGYLVVYLVRLCSLIVVVHMIASLTHCFRPIIVDAACPL